MPNESPQEIAARPTCSVSWFSEGKEICGNPATHRAMPTNGTLHVYHVCERCARLAEPLRYLTNHYQGMLAGDPLWLIYPPLEQHAAILTECLEALERYRPWDKLLADPRVKAFRTGSRTGRGATIFAGGSAKVNWIRFKIRWWRWFLFGYPAKDLLDLDRQSRDIIYDRWKSMEPKPSSPKTQETKT
jgi:hypothetical protein